MNLVRRLEAIERVLASASCPECSSAPVRIIATDPETGGQWYSETMPETGCPTCGRAPIVIDIQCTPAIDVAIL